MDKLAEFLDQNISKLWLIAFAIDSANDGKFNPTAHDALADFISDLDNKLGEYKKSLNDD